MKIFTKVAAVWRSVGLLYVKHLSIWREARMVYVKVNGKWEMAYSRPRIFLYALGLAQTVVDISNRGVWFNNNQHQSGVAGRSYTLGVFDDKGFIIRQTTFDIHSDADPGFGLQQAQLFASKLNELQTGQLFFIISFDEPKTNRMLGGLPEAMYRVGVNVKIFENIQYRSAYAILGRVGRAPYYENYIGIPVEELDGNGDRKAAIVCRFILENGNPIVYGSTPIATFDGEVASADFIDGDTLAAQIGLTAGTSINSNTPWLSFTRHSKKIYIPKLPLRGSVNWEMLYNAGAVFGDDTVGVRPNQIATAVLQNKRVTIAGKTYIVRLLKGTNGGQTYDRFTDDSGNDSWLGYNSEWNDLHYLITSDLTIIRYTGPKIADPYTPAQLGFTPNPSTGPRIRFCQEVNVNLGGQTMARGNTNNVTDVIPDRLYNTTSTANAWVPCLELVE